jgi:hypothetical protein
MDEKRAAAWIATTVVTLASLGPAIASAEGKPRLGWIERIRLEPWGLVVKAKLDTGAATSSLQAIDIALFDKDGDRWVRFAVADGADATRIESPVTRFARVKRPTGDVERRPVVRVAFCLGDARHEAEFTLSDRSTFLYPVLLGRSALVHLGVVDPGATYLASPRCGHADADGPSGRAGAP